MLMLQDLSNLFSLGDGRQLQAEKPYQMNAKMIPGDYSDAANLQFNYTAEFKDNQTLHIQMLFETAEYVSSQFYEDRVMVKLSSLLLDAEDGLPLLPESRKLEKPVPPQMKLGASATTVQVVTTSIQVAATTAVAGNAALNIFLQGSLNQLWGMINNIQMIVVTPLLNIQFPGNALNLYTVMIQIATFDILPTDKFYPKIFPLPDSDQAFNDRFDNLGFGSTYFAGNFGSALLGIFWMFILYLTYPFVCYLAPSARFIEKYRRGLKSQLFWNGTILFIQEAYLDILICVLINIRAINQPWVTWTVGLSAFLTVLLLAGCIFLPLFVLFYLRRNYAELTKNSMKERFESAYEMINLKQDKNAILWCVLFFLRRAILAFAVVFSDYSAIHLMAFVYPAVMVVIWLGQYHPLNTPFDNKLELYDACSVVIISYCLFLFTDFVPDASMRYKIGWVMLLFTLQNIIVNLYFISKQPILSLIKKTKEGIQNRKVLKSKMSLNSIGQKSADFFKSKASQWKKRIFEDDSPLDTISEVSEQENSISESSDDEEEKKAIQLVYEGIKIQKKRDDMISDSSDSSIDESSKQVIRKKTKSQLSWTPKPQSVFKTQQRERRPIIEKSKPQRRRNQKKLHDSQKSDRRKIRSITRPLPIQPQSTKGRKDLQFKLLVPYQAHVQSQPEGITGVTDYYRQTLFNLKEKAARMSAQAKQREQRIRTNKLLQIGNQLKDSIDDELDFLPKYNAETRYLDKPDDNKQEFLPNAWGEAMYESQNVTIERQKKKKIYVPSVHQQKQEEQLKLQRTQLLQNWQRLQPETMTMPAYKPSYTRKAREEKKMLWQQYLHQFQAARVEGKRKDTEILDRTAITPELDMDIAANMIMVHQRRGLKKEFKEPEF